MYPANPSLPAGCSVVWRQRSPPPVRFRGRGSGRCVDIHNSGTATAGRELVLWDCTDQASQQWLRTADQMRQALVEQMMAAGSLRSVPWVDAFARVPRHVFLRRFFRQSPDLSGWEAVGEQDSGALEMVYTDATWVTQLDNDPGRWAAARASGHPVPGTPSSSSTAPSLMALMLEALDVQNGHRVLEIGTGTGYHTALLCHRLGSRSVTTVEVDPAVAEAAAAGLHACGFPPTRIVADGTAGHAGNAPYDRLIATCSTPAVPTAWLAQVRPGGLILTSLHRDLGGGPLVGLHVDGQGGAEGRFLPDYGGFMPTRATGPANAGQRLVAALPNTASPSRAVTPSHTASPSRTGDDTRPTAIGPQLLDSTGFGMLAALRLAGVASIGFEPVAGPQWWLLAGDGSWACLSETTGMVTQHGTRRLWDELEDIHRQWTDAGTPARERFGLTVTTSGEHLFWLDTPGNVWWTGPGCASGSR